MPAARVGAEKVEQVGELAHGDRLVGLDAAELAPVLLEGDAVAADDGVALPLGEFEACCEDLGRRIRTRWTLATGGGGTHDHVGGVFLPRGGRHGVLADGYNRVVGEEHLGVGQSLEVSVVQDAAL